MYGSIVARSYDKSEALIILELYQMLFSFSVCLLHLWSPLQSIYVTCDRVILKFEARVQIYVAVLNFGCEIQNSGGDVVSFSKINSCKVAF